MTTGDGNYGARWIDSRTGNDAFVDGALEAKRRAAKIANSSEPAHQRVLGLVAGHQVEVTDVRRKQLRGSRPHHHRMPVHVDQPRHQRSTTSVDNSSIAVSVHMKRCCRDLFDSVSTNQDVRYA